MRLMALTPFLMFTGQAEEAIGLYVSAFSDAEIVELDRWGSGEAGTEGQLKGARLRIAGQELRFLDSPVEHDFGFTPAVSFFFDCRDRDELDGLFERLSDGGRVLMAPDRYPFALRFAWVSDRYGVSWQLSVT